MRTKFILAMLIAGTALSTAAPAFAQDGDPGFNGPRAEAIVGWDHVVDDSIYGAKKDGVTYGGQIGYDIQRGSTVFGIEGEITGASTRERDNNVLVAGDSLRVKAGRDLYAGARLGFVAGDRALIYAKGGYTNARIATEYSSPTLNIDDGQNLDGWRLGAGAELKLTDRVYAKGEYRYSNYGSGDNGADLKRHQVVGGLGVRF
jgi:outer membrane immunogenic protein